MRLLSRRLRVFGNWNQRWSTELHGDHSERDYRGHELSLFLETWKGLYEQQWNIYKMLRNEYKKVNILGGFWIMGLEEGRGARGRGGKARESPGAVGL